MLTCSNSTERHFFHSKPSTHFQPPDPLTFTAGVVDHVMPHRDPQQVGAAHSDVADAAQLLGGICWRHQLSRARDLSGQAASAIVVGAAAGGEVFAHMDELLVGYEAIVDAGAQDAYI